MMKITLVAAIVRRDYFLTITNSLMPDSNTQTNIVLIKSIGAFHINTFVSSLSEL